MKYLQADLKDLPVYEGYTYKVSPLPSGKPFHSPMREDARRSRWYWCCDFYAGEIYQGLHPINSPYLLTFSDPTSKSHYQIHTNYWIMFEELTGYSRHFRSESDAYLYLFLNDTRVKSHPKFQEILQLYPEHFI